MDKPGTSRIAVAALATIALTGSFVGTAHAAPPGVSNSGGDNRGVGYSIDTAPGAVSTVLDGGSFQLGADGTSVTIVDDAGAALTSIPLAYSIDGGLHPVAASIGDGGRSLTITPQLPSLVHPVYSPAAYQNLVTQIEIGWRDGGSVTAGIGAGVGAVVGCILFLFVGCIPGAAIGGAIGAVNGIVGANPAVTPAVFEFVRTLP